MAGTAPILPLQKSLSRRVSFNESIISSRGDSDEESQTTSCRSGLICGFLGPVCNSVCLWICLILGLLLFAIILIGSIYFSFLRSNLPDVRVQKLEVNLIDLNLTSRDTLLTANLTVLLDVINGDDNADLVYTNMTAALSTEAIDFGEIKVEDVSQPPHSTAMLIVPAAVRNMAVEDAAAKALRENGRIHMLVIDVDVIGKIDMFVEGKKTRSLPFRIECHRIDQSEIDAGRAPKCSTELAPLQ